MRIKIKNSNANSKKMKYIFLLITILVAFTACEEELKTADAYGNFEAKEVIVSSEMGGKLLKLNVEEGQELKSGDLVAVVDTTQLVLKQKQLRASIQTISGKTQNAQPQVDVFKQQKDVLLREKRRVEALVQGNAATQKQLDDLNGQLEILDKQIAATQAQTATLNKGIMGEIQPLQIQIDQLTDQIHRATTYNPIDGIVLIKMAETAEMTASGKPLYKIADTKNMILRAYISGEQLANIKIGQSVKVAIDETATTNRTLDGKVTWISEKAEFTPKIIQTKEERVNLVYAIKIAVTNDGSLKIGMPAEVSF
jgi:HlyD family secretion protein